MSELKNLDKRERDVFQRMIVAWDDDKAWEEAEELHRLRSHLHNEVGHYFESPLQYLTSPGQ